MILPSEDQGYIDANNALPGIPDRVVNSTHRRNHVSRLEFNAMDRLGTDSAENVSTPLVSNAVDVDIQARMATMERQLKLQEEQTAVQVELAREEARTESQQEWKAKLEERVAVERDRVTRVCEEFGKERARYFAEVEAEIVKLALAIAKRVLHREAKLDPLLLTAAVRVVLEKVADDSAIELRVPVGEAERWRGVLVADTELRLQVIGDQRLDAGECILETSVGRVELGVNAQLEEIEKGFFDLLQQRPV